MLRAVNLFELLNGSTSEGIPYGICPICKHVHKIRKLPFGTGIVCVVDSCGCFNRSDLRVVPVEHMQDLVGVTGFEYGFHTKEDQKAAIKRLAKRMASPEEADCFDTNCDRMINYINSYLLINNSTLRSLMSDVARSQLQEREAQEAKEAKDA